MTHDPATLRALLARVENATGSDREIDAELRVALFGWTKATVSPDCDGQNAGWVWVPPEGLSEGYTYPPRGRIDPMFHARGYHSSERLNFTASVDAALALIERQLPEWSVRLFLPSHRKFASVLFTPPEDAEINAFSLNHAKKELALLAALLRARIEEIENA